MVAEAKLLSNPILEHLIGEECMMPGPMTSGLKFFISLRENGTESLPLLGTWAALGLAGIFEIPDLIAIPPSVGSVIPSF